MRALLAATALVGAASGVACEEADAPASPTAIATLAVPSTPATPSPLPLIDVRIAGQTFRVELAVSAEERGRGLSGRPSLAPDSGMLFDLGSSYVPSFWMKDVLIPLDIIWIDEDRRVISVSEAEPQPGVSDAEQRRYSPDRPARYVLELNGGTAARIGLGPGDEVAFDPDG